MRQIVVETLHKQLEGNMGNRLTPELITGILTTMNHVLVQAEATPAATLDLSGAQPPAAD